MQPDANASPFGPNYVPVAPGGRAPGGKYPWATHFGTPNVQTYAARFGMWLFLSTEVLLFAGLFVSYAVYRYLYPQTFALCSRHLDLSLGTINTLVLITSSLTVALAIHFVRTGKNGMATGMLIVTLLCACAFLVIKYFEYHHKFEQGTLPGRFYTYSGIQTEGAPMFFALYFLTTGLHALHVVVGMSVLTWVTYHVVKGRFSPVYYTPVELGGLYWHLVDLVWIFLYPLLYLI
ncbi:MAG: cytochrome c oxidase subunit 3 family protein [Myxococcaceae bacterium]|nr:cytochrome c oxidase subunit 3 family protein [Myxococcaceae bacterium]